MKSRHLYWQLPILILLTAPLWHGAAAQFLSLEQRTSMKAPAHQDSSFMMEDVVFRQVQHGLDEYLLHALRLQGADQNKGFDLERVEAQRLGPNPFSISGGNAHYDPDQEVLTMLDDVVVHTADLVVKTPVLRYLAKFATFKGAAEVELIGQGFNISGTSFMYNHESGNLRVGQRVKFIYTPPAPPAIAQTP